MTTGQEALSSSERWRLAWQYSYPIALGYVPAAIAFGVLMSAAGLPTWLALAMSVIVYSGAAQYAAVALFADWAGVFTLTLNTFIINLRHVLYALPLLEHLPSSRLQRAYSLFTLTDESFSVMTSMPEHLRAAIMSRVLFCNQMYWVVGTAIGALLGAGLNDLIPHLDFALTCLFVVLAYEQYRNRREWWPCVVALVMFVVAKSITQQYLLLLAVGLCVLAIVLRSAFWAQGAKK